VNWRSDGAGERINRSVGPIGAPHAYATGQSSNEGMTREARDAVFNGTAAVEWWQTTREFVRVNWDWMGVALVLIACAIVGWAVYRALRRGIGSWRDEI
jgi:hypothetical protein